MKQQSEADVTVVSLVLSLVCLRPEQGISYAQVRDGSVRARYNPSHCIRQVAIR